MSLRQVPKWVWIGGGALLVFVLLLIIGSRLKGASTSVSTGSSGSSSGGSTVAPPANGSASSGTYATLQEFAAQIQADLAAQEKQIAALTSANKNVRTEPYAPPPPIKGPNTKIIDPGPIVHKVTGFLQKYSSPKNIESSVKTSPSHTSSQTVTVTPGESFWSIATAHHLTLAALEAANPAFKNQNDYNTIYSGQKVVIP